MKKTLRFLSQPRARVSQGTVDAASLEHSLMVQLQFPDGIFPAVLVISFPFFPAFIPSVTPRLVLPSLIFPNNNKIL